MTKYVLSLNHVETVRELLALGAKVVDVRHNVYEYTSLMLAAAKGRVEILRLLLSHLRKPWDIDHVTGFGYTPFLCAVNNMNTEVSFVNDPL